MQSPTAYTDNGHALMAQQATRKKKLDQAKVQACVAMVRRGGAGASLRAGKTWDGGDPETMASRFIAPMPAGNDAPFLHLMRTSGDAEDRGG